MKNQKICPCCFSKTLSSTGNYELCPVCFWEDDPIQSSDPNYEGGANKVSLNQAQVNFKKIGACSVEFIGDVREPLDNEK